jgi:cell wall-associated NlpC family hydrolase
MHDSPAVIPPTLANRAGSTSAATGRCLTRESTALKKLLYLFAAAVLCGSAITVAAQKASSKSSTESEEDEATPRPRRKGSTTGTPRPQTTPKPKKSTSTSDETESTDVTPGPVKEAASPPPKSSAPRTKSGKKTAPAGSRAGAKKSSTTAAPGAKSKPETPSDEELAPLPTRSSGPDDAPKKKSAPAGEASDAAAKTTAAVDPAAPPPGQVPAEANASLSPGDLAEFASQPPRVQKLLESSLALTRQNLTYLYGSADPANGGMDCSGFVYYVLRKNGFDDVPRAANEQYVWVRKADDFDAVLSKKKESFELDGLQPGDLLFWSGTYSTERDPPVTHAMIYLGTERSTKQRVMVGSSDGRTYHGKSRWGVSVFDFQGGQTSRDPTKSGRGGFVGYARIPGLRPGEK